jgi:hypothetical protein
MENAVYFLDTETVYLLKTYGSSVIQSVHICSTPITLYGIMTNALHVYLILELSDGMLIAIEKNERTEISHYKKRPNEKSTRIDISNSYVTLAECVHRTIQSIMNNVNDDTIGHVVEHFWGRYDLQKNNCQQLAFRIIRANGWSDAGLDSFNQGAETFSSHIKRHLKKTKAPPLAKMISSLFLEYVSNVTSHLVSERIRDTPLKESSNCMTIDCIHIEVFNDCSPEEACRQTEEKYRLRK